MDHHDQALWVRVTHRGHCSVLEVGGHLDFITASTLAHHVGEAWSMSDGPRLVLELSQLAFYDSTALGVLAQTRQRVQDTATGRLVLVGLPDGLAHLLLRTGLLSHFEVCDDIEQAAADLLPPE
ncbi:STAS domain-containing protein [Streptosporangium sp. NPDC000563]|uniref:STAS domain-containing protein n=1 Tax=unclassified Streptosporangium TaxID=2632669 RepID=UPI0033255CC5